MRLILILAVAALTGCAAPNLKYCDTYAKVGVGYIVEQPKIHWDTGNDTTNPISARLEGGCEYGRVTYGLSHHSQWFEGWPVNSNSEPHKTELFIDYKFVD